MKEDHSEIIKGTMTVKGESTEIDITYEWDINKEIYRIYTSGFKLGDKLEVIYDIDRTCFIIKNLDSLKKKWKRANEPLKDLLELDDGMSDMQE